MTQEQIFQLRLAAVDLASRPTTDTGTLVERAATIYEFLTTDVEAKVANKAAKSEVIKLV